MAELVTIARPYAKAAFDVARQDEELSSWSSSLKALGQAVADPEIQNAINDPRITKPDLIKVFNDSIQSVGVKNKFNNFVALLIENRRINLVPLIGQLFEQKKAQEEGTVNAKVLSAFPMDSVQQKAVVTMLEKKLKKAVNLEVSSDPKLVGGMVLQIGDQVWDYSIRGKLENMAMELTE